MTTSPAKALYSTLRYWRTAGLQNLELILPEDPEENPENLRKRKEARFQKELEASEKSVQETLASEQKFIYGSGSIQSDLMFIADAPSEEDNISGTPFSGEVGELMDRMLTKMGFQREDIYLTTILKYHKANNAQATQDDFKLCKSILFKQIDLINPKVICTLGSVATTELLQLELPIAKARGQMVSWNNRLVIPTFHPAYLLKKKGARKNVWQDMLSILTILNKTPAE